MDFLCKGPVLRKSSPCYDVVLVFRDMVIKQIGVMVQQALPGIRNAGSRLPDFFGLAFPLGIDLDVKNIKTFINSPFVLKSKVSERKKSLKGQTDIDQLTLRGRFSGISIK